MTAALEGGEWSAARPGRTLPPGKTGYPLYRRLGGPQSRSGQVQEIWLSPGFDQETVQPVAQSLYRLSYPAHSEIYVFRGNPLEVHRLEQSYRPTQPLNSKNVTQNVTQNQKHSC